MQQEYIVYLHRNKINQKVYIGQTSQRPEKRWNSGKGYITSTRFFNAILKYGWDNFEHIILYTNLSLEEANEYEQELIQKYHSTDEQYGYNISSGGKNFQHSEETKQKIGVANHYALQGRHWSDSQKDLISEKFSGEGNPFYGKHHTEFSKELISEHRKGQCVGSEHPMYGKRHSPEVLERISKHRQSKGGKRVRCINTGDIFDTMMDAARWCGLKNSSSIGQMCNHTCDRKTAGQHPVTRERLKWEFVEE